MLCYATLCYFMLHYVTLCYVTLCYIRLRYVTLCYINVTLGYIMLCYVMLGSIELYSSYIFAVNRVNVIHCDGISVVKASLFSLFTPPGLDVQYDAANAGRRGTQLEKHNVLLLCFFLCLEKQEWSQLHHICLTACSGEWWKEAGARWKPGDRPCSVDTSSQVIRAVLPCPAVLQQTIPGEWHQTPAAAAFSLLTSDVSLFGCTVNKYRCCCDRVAAARTRGALLHNVKWVQISATMKNICKYLEEKKPQFGLDCTGFNLKTFSIMWRRTEPHSLGDFLCL